MLRQVSNSEREVVLSVHKAGAGAHIQAKDVQFQKACSFYLVCSHVLQTLLQN